MIVAITVAVVLLLIVTALNSFMLSAIVVQIANWDKLIKSTLERLERYFSDDGEA